MQRANLARAAIAVPRAGLLLLLSATAMSAHAQTAPQNSARLVLQGRVAHPASFTAADLARLQPTTVAVSFETEHGPEHAAFTGELLWTLLDRAAPIDQPGRKTHLQHVVLARGRDGYVVALALAELEPIFEGKPVIVAYLRDGKPMPSLRLIVPGDRLAGRYVSNVNAVVVGTPLGTP